MKFKKFFEEVVSSETIEPYFGGSAPIKLYKNISKDELLNEMHKDKWRSSRGYIDRFGNMYCMVSAPFVIHLDLYRILYDKNLWNGYISYNPLDDDDFYYGIDESNPLEDGMWITTYDDGKVYKSESHANKWIEENKDKINSLIQKAKAKNPSFSFEPLEYL